jgi:hypothetical protein
MADFKENPLIIPTREPKARCCPKCGGEKYLGRKIQGMVFFRCQNSECKTEWGGGLPREPQDPTIPLPPMNPKDQPLVDFVRSKHDTARDGVREVRRGSPLTQPFRTGAPIPEDED